MKCTKFFRILGISLILSLLIVVLPVTPALAANNTTLDPDEGKVGDEITITGTAFSASTETSEKWARILFAKDEASIGDLIDTDVDTYKVVKSSPIGYEDDPDEGDFETKFTVPSTLSDGSVDKDVEPGTYYVYVTITYSTGTSTYIRSVAEFTVLASGEITIDPDEGPVGTEVEITGTGFGNREDIIVEYDSKEIKISDGDDKTDSSGDFECTIIIPDSTAGDHTLTVSGEDSGAETEATFTVESAITISPTEGSPETAVTVTGTGFADRSEITVLLNNAVVTEDETDRDGSFEATFNVPPITSGTYQVGVKDDDVNSGKVKFTVVATTAKLSPTSGHVGTEVTVSGTGYPGGTEVSINYDTAEVATPTTGTDGTFSTTFKVPVSQHGDHKVTLNVEATTKAFTFTMESKAPPIPKPLSPAMGVKAEPPVSFDWEDATDDSSPVTYTLQIAKSKDFAALSLALEKKDITKSEYTLTEAEKLEPASKEEPYYWRVRATDSASNESEWTGAGSFYVGGASGGLTFAGLPSLFIYLMLGLGALLLFIFGFWLGRRTSYYSY